MGAYSSNAHAATWFLHFAILKCGRLYLAMQIFAFLRYEQGQCMEGRKEDAEGRLTMRRHGVEIGAASKSRNGDKHFPWRHGRHDQGTLSYNLAQLQVFPYAWSIRQPEQKRQGGIVYKKTAQNLCLDKGSSCSIGSMPRFP